MIEESDYGHALRVLLGGTAPLLHVINNKARAYKSAPFEGRAFCALNEV
ncbi:hypothetical protein Y017_11700 [Alcanivorax sp. 97CO-5]|nr:hypothetical protein Y017_11700 [Alcanivorax sp. 97CO-5]